MIKVMLPYSATETNNSLKICYCNACMVCIIVFTAHSMDRCTIFNPYTHPWASRGYVIGVGVCMFVCSYISMYVTKKV